MAGNKQIEKNLRQVNIDTRQVDAVSESINTTTSALTYIEDRAQGTTVTSPVMKKLNALPLSIPNDDPTEEEVIRAHNEAGLTLSANSKKHPRRVSRAAEKREMQRDLLKKEELEGRRLQREADKEQQQLNNMSEAEKEQFKLDKQARIFRAFEKLDLEKLLFDKKDGSIYDKLLKNYGAIKNAMSKLPYYEAEINRRLEELAGQNLPIPEELQKSRAKLKTLYDIRAFYDVYEGLMKNKYFAMLPREEMHSLSYKELRIRLQELYSADQRNQELIDYYQNLLRLKVIDLSDVKSVNTRQQEYLEGFTETKVKEDKRDPKEEFKKIVDAYSEMVKNLTSGDSFLTKNTQKLYTAKFFELTGPDIEKFRPANAKGNAQILLSEYDAYKNNTTVRSIGDDVHGLMSTSKAEDQQYLERNDGTDLKGIALSPVQKEGVRLIGSWIMRHAFTERNKHSAFAFNLLNARPEQQLLVFYLVENEKQDGAMGIDFFSALNNYQPDLEKFKENANWENISRALRSSMAVNAEMKQYGELLAAINESDKQIRQDNDPQASLQRPFEDQRDTVVQAIVQRGIMLKMLYRNAGLHEDMPPDMAEDPVLRKKMFDLYKEIGSLAGQLDALTQKTTDNTTPDTEYNADAIRTDSEELSRDEKTSKLETATNFSGSFKEYVFADAVNPFGAAVDTGGGYLKSFSESTEYSHFAGVSGGLAGVVGFITAILTTASIATEKGITAADRTAKAFSVSSDFADSIGAMSSSAGSLVNIYTSSEETAEGVITWLGDSSEFLWDSTKFGDKLALAGGAIGAVGGVIKLTSGSINLGRGISSRKDLKRSGKTLKEREDAGELTADEKKLQLFLKHENREVTRNETSAGVDMVSGVLATATGALAMTGFLAPIAGILSLASLAVDIGYGKIANRGWRNANRKKAVDDMLNIDEMINKVKNEHPEKERIRNMKEDKLKDAVREEALAMMGFCSYHECYRHICGQYATLLYNKVFVEDIQDEKEKKMYLDAMESLGMKIKMPEVQGDKPMPSIEAMIAKMMDE